MSFTETTREGFFSRLMGSFMGLLIGPILVIAAIWLLAWNEGRAVQAIVGLNTAAKSVIESSGTLSSSNEGKLVHIVAPATALSSLHDPDLGLSFKDSVAVRRMVELYQWKEKKESSTQNNIGGSQSTTTTYSYEKVWSENPIDSSTFNHPDGHRNVAMPFSSQRFYADKAKLGTFDLTAAILALFNLDQPVNPETPPQGYTKNGNALYKGADPSNPAIGDLRVSYFSLASGTVVSVLAAQSQSALAPFVASNGYTIALARVGDISADQMIAEKRKSESTFTWILRGAGAVAIFIGFALFFGPLSTFASIIPFLGTIVRGAAAGIAFVLTVPVTLVTIAVAWLAFRPIIGGGLLVLAAIAIYALWRWHRGRTPRVVALLPRAG